MLPQVGDPSLVGTYGDIFWDLPPVLSYNAGEQIGCTIYVANVTDVDRSYMLRIRVTQDSTVISEGTLKVNNKAWFDIGAQQYAVLPGSMLSEVTNAVLTIELVDNETSEVTDSVSVSLVSAAVTQLPVWETPAMSTTIDLITLMLVLVMMGMMMRMTTKKKEKE